MKLKKKIIFGSLVCVATSSALIATAFVEKFKNHVNQSIKVGGYKEGVALISSETPLSSSDSMYLGLPTNLHVTGTNGFGKIADQLPKNFEISAVDSNGNPTAVDKLKNGDVVTATIQGMEMLLGHAPSYKFVVSDLHKSFAFPKWGQTLDEFLPTFLNKDSDPYFDYVEFKTTEKDPIRFFQARLKNPAFFETIPNFTTIAYYNPNVPILSTWNDGSDKTSDVAKITPTVKSTNFMSSFGVFNYGHIKGKVDTGKIKLIQNMSAKLSDSLFSIKFNDEGPHNFDNIDITATNVTVNIFDKLGKNVKTVKVPDQRVFLQHKDVNFMSHVTTAFASIDPIGSLARFALAAIGGAFTFVSTGLNDIEANDFTRTAFGYDNTGKYTGTVDNVLSYFQQFYSPIADSLPGALGSILSLSPTVKNALDTYTNVEQAIKLIDQSENKETADDVSNIFKNPNNEGLLRMLSVLGILKLAAPATTADMIQEIIDAINKSNELNTDKIIDMATKIKTVSNLNDFIKAYTGKVLMFNLNSENIDIPENGYYEISFDFDYKLGSAFSGNWFHIWSNSNGSIDEKVSDSRYYSILTNANGLLFIKK